MSLQPTRQHATGEKVGVVVIHGIGESDPGWINDRLVKRMKERADTPLFASHSELYELEDRGRRSPGTKVFPVHVRRGVSAGGRDISLIELYWADLSKIGTGAVENWLATLKLFYEAPQVLGDCFFDNTKSRLAAFIGWLLSVANWIMRWPITGLNTVAFVAALILLARQKLLDVGTIQPYMTIELPFVLAGLLGVLALSALGFARWRVHRDIALTDIGMSTAVFAALAAAAALIAKSVFPPDVLSNPAIYLHGAALVIFGFWGIWNHAILIAIVAFVLLLLQHAVTAASAEKVRLARPAAAIGLSIVQGVIYKVVFALLWVFIFVTLDFNERTGAACAPDLYGSCAELAKIRNDLFGIVVFNLILLSAVAVAYALVAGFRAAMRWPARRLKRADAVPMPRMIVSPLIVFVLMAGTIFNLIIFYWREWIPVNFYALVDVKVLPVAETLFVLVGGGTLLSAIFTAFRAMQHASRGTLHIARDVVDHQYTPRFTLSRYLLPGSQEPGVGHPRRERIEKRLDTLLEELVARESFDRIVFVAHSQGTVILHDYLRSDRDETTICRSKPIDMLTLGSPLSHIYRTYFEKYDHEASGPGTLNPCLRSWTNMWRVDDPIGNKVDIIDREFIDNVPLRPGGHVDYWKEPQVLEAILGLIDPERRVQTEATSGNK